jgi:hypothetical protein
MLTEGELLRLTTKSRVGRAWLELREVVEAEGMGIHQENGAAGLRSRSEFSLVA